MLSQLNRLIGLEGRPQANWIYRGLINSGKVLFFLFFFSQPNIHAGPTAQPRFTHLFSHRIHLFSEPPPHPSEATLGMRVYVFVRVRQTVSPSTDFNQIPFNLSDLQQSSLVVRLDGGIRVAGVKRALGVGCQHPPPFFFQKKECWFSHQPNF